MVELNLKGLTICIVANAAQVARTNRNTFHFVKSPFNWRLLRLCSVPCHTALGSCLRHALTSGAKSSPSTDSVQPPLLIRLPSCPLGTTTFGSSLSGRLPSGGRSDRKSTRLNSSH